MPPGAQLQCESVMRLVSLHPSGIRVLLKGGDWLPRVLTERLLGQWRRMRQLAETKSSLTLREREILSHLAEGLTSKQIALNLDISHRTVEVYRAKLLKKFGVSNTSGLFHSLGGIDSDHVVSNSTK